MFLLQKVLILVRAVRQETRNQIVAKMEPEAVHEYHRITTMSDQEHVIYVSYEDADKDRVINLVNRLKVCLRKQLGKIDDNFIWAKYMLRGNENCSKTPQQHLQQSKYLLTVLSPAYMGTIGDIEIEFFKNADGIFVVECDRTCRPEKLKSFKGYKFWHEDKIGNVVRWVKDRKYYRLLDQIARDIAAVIGKSKEVVSNTLAQTSLDNYESQPIPEVFIDSIEEDRAVALKIQDHLDKDIISSLLPSSGVGLSPEEVQVVNFIAHIDKGRVQRFLSFIVKRVTRIVSRR
jgi:hypothetical protein